MPFLTPRRRTLAVLGAVTLAAALGAGAACHRSSPQVANAATQPPADAFGSVSVDEVDTLIKRKAVHVYDNNSEDRYKVSHVPTAKWVQFDEVKASDLPQEKDAKLVFYCANEH